MAVPEPIDGGASNAQPRTEATGGALVDGLPIGQRDRDGGRTISEGEFSLIHALMHVDLPIHVNKQHMQGSPFGERILAGPVVLCLVASGWGAADLSRRLERDYGVEWIAGLGLEGRLHAPVRPGDTVYLSYCLESARATRSDPARGIMTIGLGVENQDDQLCCTGTLTAMFARHQGGGSVSLREHAQADRGRPAGPPSTEKQDQ